MPEAEKDPHGDSEGPDTDEQFQDHPELAPPEGRISAERMKGLEAEAHQRGLTGDAVEDAGDQHRKIELNFVRNSDFGGNELAMAEEPVSDYGRGSGFIGGKLVGEGAAGDWSPSAEDSRESEPADDQGARIAALRLEGEEIPGDWSAHTDNPEAAPNRDQGRSIISPSQHPETHEHKVWAAILRRLGGSSPGSQENLQLAEKFSKVQFPSDRQEVLQKLEPGAEFRLREGITVDLHQAVERSRSKVFRNLGDLVDCVKDELRRQETEGLRLLTA